MTFPTSGTSGFFGPSLGSNPPQPPASTSPPTNFRKNFFLFPLRKITQNLELIYLLGHPFLLVGIFAIPSPLSLAYFEPMSSYILEPHAVSAPSLINGHRATRPSLFNTYVFPTLRGGRAVFPTPNNTPGRSDARSLLTCSSPGRRTTHCFPSQVTVRFLVCWFPTSFRFLSFPEVYLMF